MGNGQIDEGSPNPTPANQSHPTIDSLVQPDLQTDNQIDSGPMLDSSAVPEDAALTSAVDSGPAGSAVNPAQDAHIADADGAPDLAAEQQGKSHGTEALEALSDAAETERLQPGIDIEMQEPLENGDSAAAYSDRAEESKAQDEEMVNKDQPGSATDEGAAELLTSNAADLDADTTADHVQPESELPGMHPNKPEGQSIKESVLERYGSSDKDGNVQLHTSQ